MRTWFVTGGTPGGFGMAYANAVLATGDRVALTARRPDEPEATLTELRAHEKLSRGADFD